MSRSPESDGLCTLISHQPIPYSCYLLLFTIHSHLIRPLLPFNIPLHIDSKAKTRYSRTTHVFTALLCHHGLPYYHELYAPSRLGGIDTLLKGSKTDKKGRFLGKGCVEGWTVPFCYYPLLFVTSVPVIRYLCFHVEGKKGRFDTSYTSCAFYLAGVPFFSHFFFVLSKVGGLLSINFPLGLRLLFFSVRIFLVCTCLTISLF